MLRPDAGCHPDRPEMPVSDFRNDDGLRPVADQRLSRDDQNIGSGVRVHRRLDVHSGL